MAQYFDVRHGQLLWINCRHHSQLEPVLPSHQGAPYFDCRPLRRCRMPARAADAVRSHMSVLCKEEAFHIMDLYGTINNSYKVIFSLSITEPTMPFSRHGSSGFRCFLLLVQDVLGDINSWPFRILNLIFIDEYNPRNSIDTVAFFCGNRSL